MAVVLGVDSSTQSTKVEARDADTGAVVGFASSPHPRTEPPISEQDPESWWSALAEAVGRLGSVRDDVAAIAVGGQQHGMVLVDAGGSVIRPAKLWNDTTSSPQAADLVAILGAETWAARTGTVPVASITATKLSWMAANEPENLAATAMVMLPHDYLTWRLCGNHVTDRGDASGTGWFNPTENRYEPDLLAAAVAGVGGGDADWLARLPEVLDPSASAGAIRTEVADELGLPDSVIVGPGTGDNMAAALGLGLQSGDAAVSLGTSGTVYSVSPTATADGSGLVAGFADAAGGFLPLACTLNATRVTDTVASWLGVDAAGLAELALAASVDGPGSVGGGSEPVVLVPYFDGERTPNLPDAAGSFTGLRTTTTRERLALAAHDGVLCGLFAGLDALEAAGVTVTGQLFLIGGGARSAAYRQRAADLHGAPIVVPAVDEAVATGAAVQAAAVVHGVDPLQQARRWGLGTGLTVEPNPDVDGGAIRTAYAAAAAHA